MDNVPDLVDSFSVCIICLSEDHGKHLKESEICSFSQIASSPHKSPAIQLHLQIVMENGFYCNRSIQLALKLSIASVHYLSSF